MTPLHWAVQKGHFDVAELLVGHGAEINWPNKFELTPLMIAQQLGRLDIVNLLKAVTDDPAIAAQNLVLQLASEDGVDFEPASDSVSVKMEMEEADDQIIIPIGKSLYLETGGEMMID